MTTPDDGTMASLIGELDLTEACDREDRRNPDGAGVEPLASLCWALIFCCSLARPQLLRGLEPGTPHRWCEFAQSTLIVHCACKIPPLLGL